MNSRQRTSSIKEYPSAAQQIPRIFARLKAGRVHLEGSTHPNIQTGARRPDQQGASSVRSTVLPERQTTLREFPDES